jgi:hypothetical protein
MKLGRDVFVALARFTRADGKPSKATVRALCEAALERGVSIDDIDAVILAARDGVDLEVLRVEALDEEARFEVIALAFWIASLDGPLTSRRVDLLLALGAHLGVGVESVSGVRMVAAEEHESAGRVRSAA